MIFIKVKPHLFDKRGINHELYRPLIYWLYILNPFTKRIIEPAQGKFKIDLFKIIKSKDFNEEIELALALRLTRL